MTLREAIAAQPSLRWDICAARHHGSPESAAANPAPEAKRAMHRTILALFDQRPYWTSKQIAYAVGRPLNSISGRLSELMAMGLLERTGARMDGAAVLRMKR